MKPQLPKYDAPDTDKLSRALSRILVNISADNFNGVEVSGTTSSSANTSAKFAHMLGQIPSMVFILEGNAYVASGGKGSEDVDIRSTATSQKFRALAIK